MWRLNPPIRHWRISISEESAMAKIEVNHQTLRTVADEFDKYCTEQDKQMRKADIEINALMRLGYSGPDAEAFVAKWENVNTPDSTAIKFRNDLKNFADSLRAAAEVYRSAQVDAYNEASRLPKYLYW